MTLTLTNNTEIVCKHAYFCPRYASVAFIGLSYVRGEIPAESCFHVNGTTDNKTYGTGDGSFKCEFLKSVVMSADEFCR